MIVKQFFWPIRPMHDSCTASLVSNAVNVRKSDDSKYIYSTYWPFSLSVSVWQLFIYYKKSNPFVCLFLMYVSKHLLLLQGHQKSPHDTTYFFCISYLLSSKLSSLWTLLNTHFSYIDYYHSGTLSRCSSHKWQSSAPDGWAPLLLCVSQSVRLRASFVVGFFS